MYMKASLVIPSYNACERLYYNLLYLNMQDYPRADFEVIVVDNGSTDDTHEMLKGIEINYTLNSFSTSKNMGRAFARNYGVKESNGDIIIFLDSDMIAERSFIAKHLEAHRYCDIAVCGQSWRRVYTFYYDDFKGYLKRSLSKQLAEKSNCKIENLRDKQPLVSEKELMLGVGFDESFHLSKLYGAEKIILDKYGDNLENYCFPWSLLVTNNCSIEKNMFLKVDGFDSRFTGWGCEDLDFGYRLYKSGYKFVKQNDINSVHQEHPINFIDRGEENIFYFTKKYECIDLLLFYYGYLISVEKSIANIIMNEIEAINISNNSDMLELYRRLLVALRNKNKRINNIDQDWFYEIKKGVHFK